jgi:hypothetical protein
MGLSWQQTQGTRPHSTSAEQFVEVVYGRNDILTIHLPPDLLRNEALSNALMDVIAVSSEREAAEDRIQGLAEHFGLDVHPSRVRGERLITLTDSREPAGSH